MVDWILSASSGGGIATASFHSEAALVYTLDNLQLLEMCN